MESTPIIAEEVAGSSPAPPYHPSSMKVSGERILGKTLVLGLSKWPLIGCGLLLASALCFLSFDALRQQLRKHGALGIR